MSRRKKKRRRSNHAAGVSAERPSGGNDSPGGPLPAGKRRRIEDLVAAGKHREAVTRAKGLHARLGTVASEGLLVDVYVARVEGLLEAGMRAEARALLQTIWGRFPGARERLAPLGRHEDEARLPTRSPARASAWRPCRCRWGCSRRCWPRSRSRT